MQETMAILEGLYWLQEALKLICKEVALGLVGLVATTSFEVVATLTQVATNPAKVTANPGQVIAANLDLGQATANPIEAATSLIEATASLGQAATTLGKVVANYYYNHNHLFVAIDYYHYNYEVGLEEYLVFKPKAFTEQHKELVYLHQLP